MIQLTRDLPDNDRRAGYSISSTTQFPAIGITGRLSTDSLGIMTQGETVVQAGGGAQTGASRWGDYATMNIDPTDGEGSGRICM